MNEIQVNANDLIASLKQQRNFLADECAMQAALITELQRQKQAPALADELKKLKPVES